MKDENESMLFVDRVAFVAEVYSFSGLPAARKTLKYDSDDIKALWSQSIYRYVLLYIVDNAGRHDIDFGREGLINDLTFFTC